MTILSLVIPVYNEEDSIAECLEHVAHQSRPVDECIVVDNNCTDGTIAIAAKFANRLPLTIVQEEKPGVFWAREAGFSAASGTLLGRIDADSRIDPEWCANAVSFMDQHREVAALTGAAYAYDAPFAAKNQSAARVAAGKAVEAGGGGSQATTLYGANMVIRSSDWREVSGTQVAVPGTHEDWDLYYALKRSDKVVWRLPTILAGVSARRFAMPIRSNMSYAGAAIRTPWLHGEKKDAVRQALLVVLFFVNLVFMKAILVPFDPSDRTWRPFRNAWKERRSPVTSQSD